MRSFYRVILLMCLSYGLSLFSACGGGDDGGTTPESKTDLAEVVLSTASSAPMGRIEVAGLPDTKELGVYDVVFLDEAGTELFRLPVESPAESSAWFSAPFHPVLPTTGGPLRVLITDGRNDSPTFDLDIGTIPEAPGAFAEYVTHLREHIDQRARLVGSSYDALTEVETSAVEPRLTPLKIAQLFVDDTQNPNSLSRVADGTSDYFNPTQREMLDRIFGYARIDSLVQADIDHMADTPASGLSWAKSAESTAACVNMGPTVSTAAELSEAMKASFAAKIATSGAPGQILGATGLALGAAAFVPGLGGVAAVAGAGLYAYQTSREYIANTYPSEFVSLDFALDRPILPEDEPDFARWENVQVIAKSNGWVADKAIFDAVMQLVGASLGAAQRGKIQNSESLRDAALNDFGMSFGFLLEGNQEGIVEFCPQHWGVDITDLPYSKGQAIVGRVSTSDFREIRPLQVGADVIRVRAVSEEFGYRTVSAERPIETKAILVTATPDVIEVENPGEVVDITATIQFADDEKLEWRAAQGSWNDGQGDNTNGPTTRPLTTPSSRELYPFLVVVESLSRQGLRADGSPSRSDVVTVRLKQTSIEVTPGDVCVANGKTQLFSAFIEGVDNLVVDWSLEPAQEGGAVIGAIDPVSGLYTAPGSGTAVMAAVATSREDNAVSGRAYFEVGACECSWTLTIDGQTWAGDYVSHAFTGDFGFFSMSFSVGDAAVNEIGSIQIFPPAALNAGNVGTWEASFSWVTSAQGWVSTNTEGTQSSLTVLSNTGGQLISEASGTVVTVVAGQERYVPFNMTIRSADLGSGQSICGEE